MIDSTPLLRKGVPHLIRSRDISFAIASGNRNTGKPALKSCCLGWLASEAKKTGGPMTDYWIKIVEEEEEDIKRHHYLVTAIDVSEARKAALAFLRHFCDEDDNPDPIQDGFAFYNNAIRVRIVDIKETTKEDFKNFMLKMFTIQWK
jgi:hypothetical protein